ncbi:MAG: phosphate acyltransferase PlsX [Clostridiales bacterium]|jgi:glycerol-3-phosphate acyltransferase PlsX|nr:phosphate acyltransferase PlsX [Clostridiales bacterium]
MGIIALDLMGGDKAPYEILKGALEALNNNENLRLILVGSEKLIHDELDDFLSANSYLRDNIEIFNSEEVINNDESPIKAIKKKKNASIIKAFELVSKGEAQGVVTAGSTASAVVVSSIYLKKLCGISRPVIGTLLPNVNKKLSLLLDSGANIDSKDYFLLHHAKLGSQYFKSIFKIKNPRVGLINIGTEANKGNKLCREVFELLEKNEELNFVGNIESRDIFFDNADVLVCDGFIGNIIIKNIEGVAKFIFDSIKEELSKNLLSKLSAGFISSSFKNIKKSLDYNEVGGSILLGLSAPVIKAHGSSNYKAIKNSIVKCNELIESGFIETIGVLKNKKEN